MDIEKLITETLTEHEHVAPDPDTVFAATRQRIDRRRSVLSRPLAVAAGVAVLTLAAVTVVALNRSGPSDNAQVAAPTNEIQATDPVSTPPAAAGLTMPYTLDWLPPGEVDYLARRVTIGGTAENPDTPLYGGEYMLTVTANGQALNVDVQQFRMMEVDEAAFKSGPGSPVTINGQPAVESSVSDGPGGYELYVAHPDGGGSMYVNVSAANGSAAPPAQQLVDIGHQIAQNIRFPGDTTVTPAYGLGELPSGMRICAFDVGKNIVERTDPASDGSSGPSTTYQLGTCETMPPIQVNTGNTIMPDDGTTPGQPVQGHETSYVDDSGYVRLFVLDAVNGAPVTISGKVPLADLYDIANRLVLPN